MLPGLARARSISSLTLLAGSEGVAASTKGTEAIWMTGARSLSGSKLSLNTAALTE